MNPIRYLVVVDGEHYPPVIEDAVQHLVSSGGEVVGAVLAGGTEKLPAGGLDKLEETEVLSGEDPRALLDEAIGQLQPDAVVDLSDEPVLDYRRRHELAAVALHRGVSYRGADFRFDPPPRPRLCARPSIAIIGTGKRTGKTAVAGFVARTLDKAGRNPGIVAMGRGGPGEPEVVRGNEVTLDAEALIELADQGRHAASDYIEDALFARVPTVGCRRCGGGLAGGVEVSNVERGVELANDLDVDLILLEGSGSAIPPVYADATILVVPGSIPEEYLAGYFGPYRLLLADHAIVTMAEEPFGSPSRVSRISSLIRDAFRADGDKEASGAETQVTRTVFRPAPTRPVSGAKVFVATTAPEEVGEAMKRHLEEEHGCRVVAMTHSLSDREQLTKELEANEDDMDVLLCEVKAASVEVAARRALEKGIDVVFMDNVPCGIDGDDPEAMVLDAARLATERFDKR